MQQRIVAKIFCLLMLFSASSVAREPYLHEPLPASASLLAKKMDLLIASLPRGTVSSVVVKELDSGKLLFAKDATQNLIPASVLKVLTATVAYDVLGSDFRFATRITGRRTAGKNRSLKDVMLSFSGDPSLTRAHVSGMLAAIKKQGFREIDGNIWLDGDTYKGYPRAEGVVWNDLGICFAAPVSAIILNHNCFYARLKPAKEIGKKAVIEYDQPGWFLKVDNRIVTQNHAEAKTENCKLKAWPSFDQEYRLEGCLALDASPMKLAFSVNNLERSLKKFVLSALKKEGLVLKGRVVLGRPDKSLSYLLAEHFSAPLPELLKPVLERSDNLYADTLLKAVGAKVSGNEGSYETGIKALRQVLETKGVELDAAYLVDGSGLSRYNQISASSIAKVLVLAWKQWGQESPWLSERTLQDRWYKTGTMHGVSSVGGYVFPENGSPLVFVVMLNGLVPGQSVEIDELKAFRGDIRRFRKKFMDTLVGRETHELEKQ